MQSDFKHATKLLSFTYFNYMEKWVLEKIDFRKFYFNLKS